MNNYYAPFQRPIGYYNPSIPIGQDMNYQQPISTNIPIAQPNVAMPTQSASDMIWVLNETEAMAYPVAPNNSVTLWDKNNDTVYLKSANMQGVPSMRILDYTERTPENISKTAQNELSAMCGKFVNIDDFSALKAKFDDLQDELNELKAKNKAKLGKKEASDDEQ